MTTKPSGSNTASPPSLKAGLETLSLRKGETQDDALRRLGVLGLRFPKQVINPKDFPLFKPHLGDWSFKVHSNGAGKEKLVLGTRSNAAGAVSSDKLAALQDGRRSIGFKGDSLIMLAKTALIGEDIRAAVEIEQIIIQAAAITGPIKAFEQRSAQAGDDYLAKLDGLEDDARLLDQVLAYMPYTPRPEPS
jgi:hypothetical protein